MSLAKNPHSAGMACGRECPVREVCLLPFYLILRDLEIPDDLMGSLLEGIMEEGMLGLR